LILDVNMMNLIIK